MLFVDVKHRDQLNRASTKHSSIHFLVSLGQGGLLLESFLKINPKGNMIAKGSWGEQPVLALIYRQRKPSLTRIKRLAKQLEKLHATGLPYATPLLVDCCQHDNKLAVMLFAIDEKATLATTFWERGKSDPTIPNQFIKRLTEWLAHCHDQGLSFRNIALSDMLLSSGNFQLLQPQLGQTPWWHFKKLNHRQEVADVLSLFSLKVEEAEAFYLLYLTQRGLSLPKGEMDKFARCYIT